MSKKREEGEMTDEQKKEIIAVRDNLAKIISLEVTSGIEGSERKRFAQTFLLEAIQKANLV